MTAKAQDTDLFCPVHDNTSRILPDCQARFSIDYKTPARRTLRHGWRFAFPNPLALALKEAAAQRGQSQSDIVRLAVAKDLASIANPKRPAQPAQ